MSSSASRGLAVLANCRLVAIDLGARFTGLATCTSRAIGACPYGLVERELPPPHHHHRQRHHRSQHASPLGWLLHREGVGVRPSRFATQAEALASVMDEHRIAAAVVGMPYHADGSRSPECALVERHVAELQAAWERPIPVLFWDESFSTRRVVGPRRVLTSRASRGSHAAAATIILSEVLEALAPLEVGGESDPRVRAQREEGSQDGNSAAESDRMKNSGR
jgi:RNase H-fold protein (predicted Holliday junction resolvase)